MTQSEKNQRDAAGAYPAAVVWDLDGTLTESAPDLATALNALLAAAGLAPHPVERVRLMIGHGVAVLIERGFAAAGAPLSAEARDALVPDFMARYSACATDNTHLVPGARYALERLARAGVETQRAGKRRVSTGYRMGTRITLKPGMNALRVEVV